MQKKVWVNHGCEPFQGGGQVISPTHKRTEGRAPVWGSEFTSKDAALQGGVKQKSLLG